MRYIFRLECVLHLAKALAFSLIQCASFRKYIDPLAFSRVLPKVHLAIVESFAKTHALLLEQDFDTESSGLCGVE